MFIMHSILGFMLLISFVNGACNFHSDGHTKDLDDKMKKWDVYKNYTIKTNGYTYIVGLCVSQNANNDTIIQKGTENNTSYVLGKSDQVNLVGEDNWILLTFENGDQYQNVCSNASRTASVMLMCGTKQGELTVLQEDTAKEIHCSFMFKLQVPQMCPTVEKNNKLSGGAIFLIILFSIATVYLVGGIVFNHVQRGARGLDRIPNIQLWRRVGNLAADGCDYCCRCERPMSRAGYFLDESGPDIHGVDDDILAP